MPADPHRNTLESPQEKALSATRADPDILTQIFNALA